ncbi:MAG: chromate efflux transporter, partial [Thermoanaerobaculaceae bacterium]|nr:chromate efflux transporter [Thermoanaerobaculaceae bacterium]
TRGKMVWAFFRIGLTAYGGPAIVAQIRRMAVLKKRWLSEEEFQESLAFCQTLPGPIAVQTAAHIGWRMYGGLGAALVEVFYILPTFVLMLGLSAAYFRFEHLSLVGAVFKGLGAVVVGIVADSILSMTPSALKDWRGVLIAAAAAAGFFGHVNVLIVLAGAAVAGFLLAPRAPAPATPDAPRDSGRRGSPPGWKTTATLVSLALAFVAFVALSRFASPIYPALGAVMAKINLLSFGGGYTAIALMYNQVVTAHPWLTAKEFIDGVALGQITPGPVTITATFIGYRLGGLVGAVFATLCVYIPSALLLVLLAPQFARVRSLTAVQRAVRGLLAAFIAMLLFVLRQVATASLHDFATLTIALAAFAALRLKVDPVWIILAAVVFSGMFLR